MIAKRGKENKNNKKEEELAEEEYDSENKRE